MSYLLSAQKSLRYLEDGMESLIIDIVIQCHESNKILKYLKNKVNSFIHESKIFLGFVAEDVFKKPIYLFPLRAVAVIMLILINIGNIEIRFFPRKFPDWMEFSDHVELIVKKLRGCDECTVCQPIIL